jgi:cytochrome P450
MKTASTLVCFFFAMALYPDVMRKAQAELDSVVGRGRLPEFSDRPVLPYVSAIVKETLRWFPVVPTGMALNTTWRYYLGNF